MSNAITRPVNKKIISLLGIVMAFILVPFAFFHNYFDQWSELIIQSEKGLTWIAIMVILLLALDVFLPIPSSVLSTAAGALLGFTMGTIASFTGMTLGVLIGYYFGKTSKRAIPFLDNSTITWMHNYFKKNGIMAIAMARPIPVISETSVIFAGISSMQIGLFLFISALSNLGISLAYAYIGAYAMETNSFLLAFFGAIAIPFLWAASKFLRKRGTQ
jgi:uncharacterized membrane protein YdjX (TVP38/TMEM64 family)